MEFRTIIFWLQFGIDNLAAFLTKSKRCRFHIGSVINRLTFFIRHIVTDTENLDNILEIVQNGIYFADIEINDNEMVDIIDINYQKDGDVWHLIVHFAIIKQG